MDREKDRQFHLSNVVSTLVSLFHDRFKPNQIHMEDIFKKFRKL